MATVSTYSKPNDVYTFTGTSFPTIPVSYTHLDLKEYSNTMMLTRVVSGKYDVFLASDDFIDVTTLTQMDYMIMDSEEMR